MREAAGLGRWGEQTAEQHLLRQGARVLARNFRAASGELDLVVLDGGDLVGVEVKTRRAGQAALPEQAVGPVKLARLARVLEQFAQSHGYEECGWRIDVIALEVGLGDRLERLEHIRDAYG